MPNETAPAAVIETFELTRRFGGPTVFGRVPNDRRCRAPWMRLSAAWVMARPAAQRNLEAEAVIGCDLSPRRQIMAPTRGICANPWMDLPEVAS